MLPLAVNRCGAQTRPSVHVMLPQSLLPMCPSRMLKCALLPTSQHVQSVPALLLIALHPSVSVIIVMMAPCMNIRRPKAPLIVIARAG